MKYLSIKEVIDEAKKNNVRISELVKNEQVKGIKEYNDVSVTTVYEKMKEAYLVMCNSIEVGLKEKCKLKIEQEDGAKVYDRYVEAGKSIFGNKIGKAISMAMAVSEVNASMGKIVAAPTAGSCGILPAALVSIKNIYNLSKYESCICNSVFICYLQVFKK